MRRATALDSQWEATHAGGMYVLHKEDTRVFFANSSTQQAGFMNDFQIKGCVNNHYYNEIQIRDPDIIREVLERKGNEISFTIIPAIPDRKVSITLFGTRTSTDKTYQEASSALGEGTVTLTVDSTFTEITSIYLRFNRSSSPFTGSAVIERAIFTVNPQEYLRFENCKGGYFSTDEKYTLFIKATGTVYEGTEIYICEDKKSSVSSIYDKLNYITYKKYVLGVIFKNIDKFNGETLLLREKKLNSSGNTVVIGDYVLNPLGQYKAISFTPTNVTVEVSIEAIGISDNDINHIFWGEPTCTITVPCRLGKDDMWYPMLGKVIRHDGTIEKYEKQHVLSPSGTFSVFYYHKWSINGHLQATTLTRRKE